MKKKELSSFWKKQIDELMIDLYSADLQKKIDKNKNTFFSENGYALFSIDEEKFDFERNFIKRLKPIKASEALHLEIYNNFYSRKISEEALEIRNKSHIHFDKPDNKSCKMLKSYLESIASEIENELGTPFRIINVRAVSANKGYSEGPTVTHLDRGPNFIRKIMIYPKPMNLNYGTFEFYNRKGEHHIIKTNKPQALLFDAATLRHRGVPPRLSSTRPMIEITIITSKETILEISTLGKNSDDFKVDDNLLPQHLHNYKKELIEKVRNEDYGKNVLTEKELLRIHDKNKVKNTSLISRLLENKWKLRSKIFIQRVLIQIFAREIINWNNASKNLNIGGGFKFLFKSWINLDENNEKDIKQVIDFSKVEAMPISSGTIQKVYSSHFFERLSDNGVNKILGEINRVIAKKGSLILKITDYEKVLKAYRKNNIRFLKKTYFASYDTWKNKDVKPNKLNIVSFIFAGYWNRDFGNPYQRSGKPSKGLLPYNGPAIIEETKLKELFKSKDPNFITKELVEQIKNYPDFGGFNNQNAWGKKQFKNLLENKGFKVVTQNKFLIVGRFISIPTIFEKFYSSQYIWVIPK